ncbi:dipeptidase [Halioxenophilus sp. WMMB6]|uniref:dipeptidase n=1 Tax=Halioxenophilus sp. WMMB6 TaxID=3073815 RepID=UPI00295F49A9|nr:dipeptidase [Halioxenophilus sp. WMMB6]
MTLRTIQYPLLTLALALGITGCSKEVPAPEANVATPPVAAKAEPAPTSDQIHQQLLALDTHIDIPTTLGTEGADPSLDGPMQVDLPKMRSGGLDAGFFIVYVGQGPLDEAGYQAAYDEAERKFAAIERMVSQNPDAIVLVKTPAELKAAVAEGKLAAAIGIENAYPLGPHYEHLQEFYDRGGRYLSLTHFGHNHFGDSSSAKGEQNGVAEPVNHGLSELGLSLIDELNKLGIMVDVSHTSKESTLAAVARSKTPVIASHSGVKALFDHPRNLSDEELQAIAAKGGVVQLVAFDSYMREMSEENKAAVKGVREQMGLTAPDWYKTASQQTLHDFRAGVAALNEQFPRASISDLVDSIDYVVKLVGIDHAGIASDFGGGGGVEGWDSVEQTPAITEELLFRGYTPEEVEQIWSGNLLRVWAEVEAYAEAQR